MCKSSESTLGGRELLKSKYFSAAKVELMDDPENFDNHFNLLVIVVMIYRLFGNIEKSLEYAHLLIMHHPDKWEGHGLMAQSLAELEKFEEAQKCIDTGLQKLSNHFNLLCIANDIYRSSGNREKSFQCAKSLVNYYPNRWESYVAVGQDFVALGKFKEACIYMEAGLKRCSNHFDLILTAANVFCLSSNRKGCSIA